MAWTAIRRASLPATPWPNGRGITRDYVVRHGPGGAPCLRVTLAELTQDAPFSDLPGTERVFTIAGGDPVELTIDGAARRCEPLHPVRFGGGARTTCRMLGGPAEAFNLFYDPAVLHADVALLADGTAGPGELYLFCPAGGATVDGLALGPGDLAAGTGPVQVTGTVLAVTVAT